MITDTPAGAPLSAAEEKRVAKALSPPMAWPTLALAVALPAAFWSLVARWA